MAGKNGFVSMTDNFPTWLKIIFCLPVLNLWYAIYRIVKGCSTNSPLMIIVGVIWIIVGTCLTWLIDLLCTIFSKSHRPIFCA